MNKKFIFPLIIAVIFFSLIGCQSEEVSPLSASMSELTGKVEMRQAGQDGFVLADANSTLEVNGQVQTGDDGRVRLDLSSGTIIRIAPSSLFTLTSNDEGDGGLLTKIKLDLGKIFIILNGGQADVETPSGVASVRGSYMKVEVDPVTKNIYITCLEGNCSASNPAGAVNFTAGEKVILFAFDANTGTWTLPDVTPMTQEDFDEWLNENPEAQVLYEQAMATATALQKPENTSTPTASPTLEQALPATEASNACFKIIQPASNFEFTSPEAIQTFEWTNQTGASYYVITFHNENKQRAIIETVDPRIDLYLGVFPSGGNYEWFVTAYDANNNEICSSTANTFSKPRGEPTAKPTKEPEAPVIEPTLVVTTPTTSGCTHEDKCDVENSVCYDEDYYYSYCYNP